MAWKFPSGQSVTKLREIRISHGRFGRLTPVAVLDPVELGGVTVQSASLHNEEDIHRKDIRPGTTVNVERAGDVIPQVTGPADPQANQEQPPFNMPERCPSCGNRVETRKDEVGHWCPNMDCPALLPEQLKSFVGKRAMEIDGLGEHWCQELVEQGLVENVGDLYFLTRGNCSNSTGWVRGWQTGYCGTLRKAAASHWNGPLQPGHLPVRPDGLRETGDPLRGNGRDQPVGP